MKTDSSFYSTSSFQGLAAEYNDGNNFEYELKERFELEAKWLDDGRFLYSFLGIHYVNTIFIIWHLTRCSIYQ